MPVQIYPVAWKCFFMSSGMKMLLYFFPFLQATALAKYTMLENPPAIEYLLYLYLFLVTFYKA